jgi:putative endonuclease
VADAPHLAAGRWAESAAARYLRRRGLSLLHRNFRCRAGEIDLVMRDGAMLVFVEVRYRADARFVDPAATVTPAKQRRLLTAAAAYLARYRLADRPCRFDVVTLTKRNYRPEFRWVQDAFGQDV